MKDGACIRLKFLKCKILVKLLKNLHWLREITKALENEWGFLQLYVDRSSPALGAGLWRREMVDHILWGWWEAVHCLYVPAVWGQVLLRNVVKNGNNQTDYQTRSCLISSANISILQFHLISDLEKCSCGKILLLIFKVARYFHHILGKNKILISFDKTDKIFSSCLAFL